MRVRRYTSADRPACLALAHRLREGVAEWRDPGAVTATARDWLARSLDLATSDLSPAFVAEVDGRVAGVVTVSERRHFTGTAEVHVAELVVDEGLEGRGIGSALVRTAEEWGRTRGLRRLSLETGAANHRARSLYAALGYQEEDVRLSKDIAGAAASPIEADGAVEPRTGEPDGSPLASSRTR
ncbi:MULTISPECIES: GNAT family N-acetyltransferase [Actinoalloteichus]|uniref:Ribosomal protein S18 acetylase RimI n=1 Tax=Actinoalloteichus caeruleus DSM 43889 TaxID=1120930 RepID=A0ABT1JNX2_ACTCY|nr:GNAT family N-acetyltransferase [Actinoalloteichus caeruleus]MCP2334224.1 Ribosomal protein S18 acetylase RimI [Actinoalloteichus caeruleus DSM 43889]